MNVIANVKQKYASYQSLDAKDKKTFWKEALINNALYILLVIAIIYTYTQNHRFLAPSSIVNIISLSAANLPIACGIAGFQTAAGKFLQQHASGADHVGLFRQLTLGFGQTCQTSRACAVEAHDRDGFRRDSRWLKNKE